MKRATLFFLFFLSHQFAFCQNGNGSKFRGSEKLKKADKYYSISGVIAATQYQGDLNQHVFSTFLHNRSTDISISTEIERQVSKQFAISGCLAWIRLTADDFYMADVSTEQGVNDYTRNLSFRNDLLEFSFKTKFYLTKNQLGSAGRPAINPYIFSGAGISYHNPKARVPEFSLNNERFENAGKWTELRPLGTEGQFSPHYNVKPYSYLQPVIPVGLGANFKINAYFDVGLEISFRYSFTDFLDDVSGNYVDLGGLDGELAKSLSYRAGEVNSSNGRNPRNFELIYENTQPVVYSSAYDGNNYQVLDGFGSVSDQRGDDQNNDFYILTGFRITYILTDKKEK